MDYHEKRGKKDFFWSTGVLTLRILAHEAPIAVFENDEAHITFWGYLGPNQMDYYEKRGKKDFF